MILHTDSFDNYATADLLDMYTQIYDSSGYHTPTVGAFGRRGTQGIQFFADSFVSSACPAGLALVIPNTEDTVGIGLALQWTGSFGSQNTYLQQGTNSSVSPVLSLSNTPSAGGNPISTPIMFRSGSLTQIALVMNRNGTFSIARGSGLDEFGNFELVDAILGTSSLAFLTDTYYYVEMKVKISTTVGTVEVRVNGDVWLSLTGVNTQPATTPAYTDEIVLGCLRLSVLTEFDMEIDDYVIWNTDAGDTVNTTVDFLGDVELTYLPPTEDVLRGWTPLTGTDHFAMVDEIPPDGDASYNYTSTISAIDTFLCDTATLSSVDILALTVVYDRRRTTGGNTSTCPVWRVAGTNYLRDAQGDPTTYAFWQGTWTKNPATLGTITVGAFAASSVGYKKVT